MSTPEYIYFVERTNKEGYISGFGWTDLSTAIIKLQEYLQRGETVSVRIIKYEKEKSCE